MDERAGMTGAEVFIGMPIHDTYAIERGRCIVASDPAGSGVEVVMQGRGLLRGVAYRAKIAARSECVERGYLIGPAGPTCRLIDATTGAIRTVHADDCTAIEERYEWRPFQDEYHDAFRQACIEVLGEDPDEDWT